MKLPGAANQCQRRARIEMILARDAPISAQSSRLLGALLAMTQLGE
jgi:hypothetical protein